MTRDCNRATFTVTPSTRPVSGGSPGRSGFPCASSRSTRPGCTTTQGSARTVTHLTAPALARVGVRLRLLPAQPRQEPGPALVAISSQSWASRHVEAYRVQRPSPGNPSRRGPCGLSVTLPGRMAAVRHGRKGALPAEAHPPGRKRQEERWAARSGPAVVRLNRGCFTLSGVEPVGSASGEAFASG